MPAIGKAQGRPTPALGSALIHLPDLTQRHPPLPFWLLIVIAILGSSLCFYVVGRWKKLLLTLWASLPNRGGDVPRWAPVVGFAVVFALMIAMFVATTLQELLRCASSWQVLCEKTQVNQRRGEEGGGGWGRTRGMATRAPCRAPDRVSARIPSEGSGGEGGGTAH